MEEHRRASFVISSDKRRLDVAIIHPFLSQSYWAKDISISQVESMLAHSICFGVYDTGAGNRQIGFARVVTDCTVFAYLMDVFILENYRGRGLGRWLVQTVLAAPEFQAVRRWMLASEDAQGLYAQVGFRPLARPERFMELFPR